MGWKLIGKPSTTRATKALATKFAEMETIPNDRDLSERRLMIYGRLFRAGLFRPVTWATCHCKQTGATYRVNGKHTSTMLSGMDDFSGDFYVVLEHYEADTLEDVAKLYSTFDSRDSVRTVRDINSSFSSVVPELANIPAKTIGLAVSGMSYAKHQQAAWSIPPAERAEALLDHVEFVVWLNELFYSRAECGFLMRVPVVAAIFLSYQRSRKDASRFWEAVRDQSSPRNDTPDRKIAKWLMQNSVNFGLGASKVESRKASNREFLVRCLHAWNAWRKGVQTDLRYYAEKKVPAVA